MIAQHETSQVARCTPSLPYLLNFVSKKKKKKLSFDFLINEKEEKTRVEPPAAETSELDWPDDSRSEHSAIYMYVVTLYLYSCADKNDDEKIVCYWPYLFHTPRFFHSARQPQGKTANLHQQKRYQPSIRRCFNTLHRFEMRSFSALELNTGLHATFELNLFACIDFKLQDYSASNTIHGAGKARKEVSRLWTLTFQEAQTVTVR